MIPEKILYEGQLPFRAFHFSHGLFWFLVLGWNFGLLSSYLARRGLHLKITSQRIVLTRGAISRRVEEVEYYRVTDTTASQSIMQRLFGFGTITILSTDQTCSYMEFPLHDPLGFREQIREHVRTERKRLKSTD